MITKYAVAWLKAELVKDGSELSKRILTQAYTKANEPNVEVYWNEDCKAGELFCPEPSPISWTWRLAPALSGTKTLKASSSPILEDDIPSIAPHGLLLQAAFGGSPKTGGHRNRKKTETNNKNKNTAGASRPHNRKIKQ